MKKLLLLLLLSFNSYADTGAYSFTAPTEREDGSPLLQSMIGGYNVYVNNDMHTISPLLPDATSFTLEMTPGGYQVEVTTVDTDGRESVRSEPVITVVPFKPKAPTGLTIITITVQ